MKGNEETTETLPPHDAFAIIGNQTRIQILQTLWECRPEPMSFMGIFEQVDVDDTGKFNYHLDRLIGNHIKRSQAGYSLRNSGRQVVMAILANNPAENPLREPVPVGTSCYECGSAIKAWYEDGWLHVQCRSCDQIYAGGSFPSAGFKDRSIEEILSVFDQRHKQLFELARNGSCPTCASRVVTTPHVKSDDEPGPPIVVRYDCTNCGLKIYSPVGFSILDNLTVSEFLKDHDIDPTTVFGWELEWCYDESYVDIQTKNPLSIVVRIPARSEQILVTLDKTLSVTETERIRI